jgi:phage tail-like protein
LATGERKDPARVFNFEISLLDSKSALTSIALTTGLAPAAGFLECTGLEATMPAEEYREGGRNGGVLKFPARVAHANIKLRRGVAFDADLWMWHYGFVEGQGKRRDGTITLLSDEGKPVRIWQFTRGLPVRWTGPAFNALNSQVAIEELEISHEGFRMQSPGTREVVDAIKGLF